MAINGQKLADAMNALLPTDGSSTDRTRVEKEFLTETKEVMIPLAAGADLTLGLFEAQTTILVTECKVEPANTVASNTVSFWQFQLVHNDGSSSGAANTAITTTFTGSTTALAAIVPASLTMNVTGGVQVASGNRVGIIITGNDTVAANTFSIRVKYKKIG